MDSLNRTGQRLEITFKKVVHLRDYENEEYSGSLTATFNRALTPDESVIEINKLQAEIEYAIFNTLYFRKLITTHDYEMRKRLIVAQLEQLGVKNAAEYLMKGGCT